MNDQNQTFHHLYRISRRLPRHGRSL
jgi:hypothetical protein